MLTHEPRRKFTYHRNVRPWLVLLAGCYASNEPPFQIGQKPRPPRVWDYSAICQSIADEIAELHAPQLVDYQPITAECRIGYAYHTHDPPHIGGWESTVPNPDPDGVWFYIGVWDPSDPAQASLQLNTQPGTPSWWIGKRRVTFVILEGERTTRIAHQLLAILKHHEMTER